MHTDSSVRFFRAFNAKQTSLPIQHLEAYLN